MSKSCLYSIVLFLLFAFFTSQGTTASPRHPRTLQEALDSLDIALKHRERVHRMRHHTVDSLSGRFRHHRHHREAREVADAYRNLNIDSAVTYYLTAISLAEEPGDSLERRRCLMEYAGQLGKAGHFTEAVMTLDSINPDVLPRLDRLRYYDLRSQIYIDGINSTRYRETKDKLQKSAIKYLDSLTSILSTQSIGQRMTNAMRLSLNNDSTLAIGELKEFMDSITPAHPLYGMASGLMAGFLRNRPDKNEEYVYYLTLASTADALTANGEAYTLELLGSEMFKRGDFDHAFTYLTVAGDAIHELGTRKRFSYDAPPLSILLESMQHRDRVRQTSLIVALCLLGLAIITFIITVYRISRRSHRQQKIAETQALAAVAKDKYISQLLDLCSSLYDSLEDFNRLVGRKIKANQTHDLYQTVESGKILKEQSERFFKTFDQAVLNIFPTFVDDINSLLATDKRITLADPGTLIPELRIAAFLRLGLTDSNRIARLLGLSLNTVYTYRNRMKSRAVNRETFEQDLVNLDKNA